MALQNTKFVVQAKGGPLQATTAEKPTVSEPSEVVIRLKAIAINPADCKMIDQGQRVTTWPFVPGLDGAGVVEAVGSSVRHFAPGDEVLAQFTAGDKAASYQAFAVIQEHQVAKKPMTWSMEEAASLTVSYLTAISGLGIGLKIALPFVKEGPTSKFSPASILVLGGSSALGAAALQLLRLALPACNILTTSSPKHHGHLSSLGADRVFDRSSASLVKDVKGASPSFQGVDAILDTVGAGATDRHIFEAFNPHGPRKFAQVWTGDDEIEVPGGVDSVMFRSRDLSQMPGARNLMLALQTLLEEGKYKLPLPVHNVGEGLDALDNGLNMMRKGVSGEKLVVTT